MGVDPEFDLWNYFFCVRRPQDTGMVIHVKSKHGVDPYFNIDMPRSMKGWRKKWFFLRNNASVPLPPFNGSHPVPLPSRGDGVTRRDLGKLQPMHEALQQL
jgi:hypothetical protein